MSTLLDETMLDYWSKLTIEQQEAILSLIRTIVEPHDRTTIEQYNKEIDAAMQRTDAGHFYTQEEVEEMAKKW